MGKIRLVKILTLFFLIFFLSGVVYAYENINEVPYSGHVSTPYYSYGNDWDFPQVYYQKLKTDNISLSINKIQLYLPDNITSLSKSSMWDQYLRIGIANLPLLTPIDFYNASLINRFQCYANSWELRYRGSFVNFSMSTGSTYVEPNTDYYIAWYVWADGPAAPAIIYYPRGSNPGVFGEWSVHRGNVTSTVWTNAFATYNLSHVLWGYKMDAYTWISGYTSNATTSFITGVKANDGYTGGRNWTYGVWLGNDTTDLTSWEQNHTLKENSTTLTSYYYFTNLMPGKFYHVRGWVCKNDSYPLVHGNEAYFLTNPLPPTNLTEMSRDANNTVLNWTKGESNESNLLTVVFKSNTGYVSDPEIPGDAIIIYNGTANETTVTTGAETCYFTAFAFLQREENGNNLSQWSYQSDTLLSTAGALDYTVRLFNEKGVGSLTVSATNWAGYEFSTKDHVVNYMGNSSSCNFTVICNKSDILTIRYQKSTGEIIERCLQLPESNSSADRVLDVYIPEVANGTGKGYTRPVTIHFVDYTGRFNVETYGVGVIKKSKDNATIIVHSDYVQADNAIRTYLIMGDQYYFYAKSDELEETRLGGLLIYDDDYTIDVTSDPITNDTWRGYVSLTSGWSGASGEVKTLWIILKDSTQGLYETTVRLFDSEGTEKSNIVYTASGAIKSYNFNFTYATGEINKSAYYANIYMKYHKNKVWWNDSTNYFWYTDISGIEVDIDQLNDMLTDILGPSPVYIPATDSTPETVIPYGTLVASAIIVMFLFIFKTDAGFAIIIMGVVTGILRLIGILSEATLSDGVIGIIILIGILLSVFLIKRKHSAKPEEEE